MPGRFIHLRRRRPAEGGCVLMARCPVCQSVRIVVVIGPVRRAFCTRCEASWVQEGSVQRAVQRFENASPVTSNRPLMQ